MLYTVFYVCRSALVDSATHSDQQRNSHDEQTDEPRRIPHRPGKRHQGQERQQGALQRGLGPTVRTIPQTVSFVLGVVIVPFWMFYVLNDEAKAMLVLRTDSGKGP